MQSIAAPINAETAALDDGQSVDEVIAHWAKENDLVVTKGARESVKSIIFNTNTYKKPSITIYPYPSDPEVIGSEAPREKKVGGRSYDPKWVASRDSIPSILTRYPTVILAVQPVPPRDYSVRINGEELPVSEKAVYCVAPGSVTVRIERKGKPPCDWKGSVSEGQNQLILCTLK